MAIKLENKPNVEAPSATYPYGAIKDNTGSNDGTPVNTAVYGDFHQFFARMLGESGVTPNGLPDNQTNGFQYFEALRSVISSFIPKGIITMWSGNVSAIPAGWRLCDGTGGTPDLRGRFVVGYKSDQTEYNQVGKTAGANTYNLSVAQLPSHSHGAGTLEMPDHLHTAETRNNTSGSGENDLFAQGRGDNNQNRSTHGVKNYGSDINVRRINGNTASTGNGASIDNRPLYYVVAYIIKM